MWRITKAELTGLEELGFLCTFVHGNLIKLTVKVKGGRVLKFRVWDNVRLLEYSKQMRRLHVRSDVQKGIINVCGDILCNVSA